MVGAAEPIVAREEEHQAIRELEELYRQGDSWTVKFVSPSGEESIALPETVAVAVRELIDQMSRGAAVAIVPYHKELTTQEAADILNVSRQYLVRLLDRDDIPHHKVNRHRRVYFGDLMEYKRVRDERRRKALKKLTQMSQEMGLYE